MGYIVKGNLRHDGALFTCGDTVELSDAQAQALIASGIVEVQMTLSKSKPGPKPLGRGKGKGKAKPKPKK